MMTIQEAIIRINKEIRVKKCEWVKIRYGTLEDYENTERIRDLETAQRILRPYLKEESKKEENDFRHAMDVLTDKSIKIGKDVPKYDPYKNTKDSYFGGR